MLPQQPNLNVIERKYKRQIFPPDPIILELTPHLAVSWRPLVLAEAEVTLLFTSASCCSWSRLCSCSSPCSSPMSASWSGMSARWLCRLLVLRVGVAGPGRGRGELRLAQLPAELLTSWLAAAGGSSELVLHDEKLELLCFLQHNTLNILPCSRYFPQSKVYIVYLS